LLERQLLLKRTPMPAAKAIEHLVGMQAQIPQNPYVGLWTRLEGFDPDELSNLIAEREAVRIAIMRSTIHLLTAADCLRLRPLYQPMLERYFDTGTPFARNLDGVDRQELAAAGRRLLEEQPLTLAELGNALGALWPGRDPTSLAYGIRHLLPIVQVPPRGLWGKGGASRSTTAEHWLGAAMGDDASPEPMIRRYLAAFGPASTADVQAWSGLRGLKPVLERMRPGLRAFQDEHGRELFDVPNGPLPDPGEPAPVRFLPDYDNLLLAHADRSRVIADGRRSAGIGRPTVLVDGFVAATWTLRSGLLRIEPFERLSKRDRAEVEAEGALLLDFLGGRSKPRAYTIEWG
jgi:hypothetical protein